jgi:hypothetical protein
MSSPAPLALTGVLPTPICMIPDRCGARVKKSIREILDAVTDDYVEIRDDMQLALWSL